MNGTFMQVEAVSGLAKSSSPSHASRWSARPNVGGRAGTNCFAVRAGGVRFVASGTTQHKMQVRVAPRVRPNPSFEPTRSGRPLQAFISFSALRALPPRAAQLKR